MPQSALKIDTSKAFVTSFGLPDIKPTLPNDKMILGGKGYHLAVMEGLGLPVPPGLIISTDACHMYQVSQKVPSDVMSAVHQGIRALEQTTMKKFGGGQGQTPLLLSVRSGAPVSMPGMMDTILNIGLNDSTVQELAARTNNPRFAFDSYRRLIQMYGDVVLEVPHEVFSTILYEYKATKGLEADTDIAAVQWQEVISHYQEAIIHHTGKPFPQDVAMQVALAIEAVFKSWHNDRAIFYRKLNHIADSLGTAVVVQSMVFGNMGEDCATGVCFTRNPSTGENILFGEFLPNAQGEDVVAGIRTPQPIEAFGTHFPKPYAELLAVKDLLEKQYLDMQDIEFTVENQKLWLLQTRSGKRSAKAAVSIATSLVLEGKITKDHALKLVDAGSIHQLLHPCLKEGHGHMPAAKGLPASPGAAQGYLAFTADEAVARAKNGEAVILVRQETCPDDIIGMQAAKGVLTSQGGMTSHAAVVARGMGCPCVTGATTIKIDSASKIVTINKTVLSDKECITIDGHTGAIYLGHVPVVEPEMPQDLTTILEWADAVRRLRIRTNAETAADIEAALAFGAEGIGLCRTEHMFFEQERMLLMQAMILAASTDERLSILKRLKILHQQDFERIFKMMGGLPITVRLLDPPLHEFMPQKIGDKQALAKSAGVALSVIEARITALHESNPMLGHRGCRLGITYPDVYDMQSEAIFTAAKHVADTTGMTVNLEVMIPLVGHPSELAYLKSRIKKIAEAQGLPSASVSLLLGVMIELPAAAVRAGELSTMADFFSFGTNDLTQTTLGISRDDAGSFLPQYQDLRLIQKDPFVSIDKDSVGVLVKMAVVAGKASNPTLKLGVCGEHGGDPDSIKFFHSLGLDYVSCSPYRLPAARIAAGQAALGG
jgi:pyruvate, orthophosphate dikinase